MQKPILDKSVLAKWLGDVISTEMEKQVEDINWELVDECEAYLAELYSDIEISDERMKSNIANIKKKSDNIESPFKRRRTPRMRRAIAAICIIASVLACGVSAYALIPEFRELIREVLNLPIGESVDNEEYSVTFTNRGTFKEYTNIDGLITEEDLGIIYPHGLDKDFYVNKIFVASEEPPRYWLYFSDDSSTVLACTDGKDISEISPKSERYENTHNVVSYITDDGSVFSAIIIDKGWTYYVTTYSKDQLITILNNLY